MGSADGICDAAGLYDARLAIVPPPFVFTIAGTNGKGSCAHLIYAALKAAGHPAGLYTSPHLFSFNERVILAKRSMQDEDWLTSLQEITAAREGTFLTYFEYCTLAAFDLLAKHAASPWALEVGLGGRLDAVNVVEPPARSSHPLTKTTPTAWGRTALP